MFRLIALVLIVYVPCSLLIPWKVRWYFKVLPALLLMVSAVRFPILYRLFGGLFFAPEAPRWILLIFAFGFSVVAALFALLVLRDCAWGGLRLIEKLFHLRKHRFPANRIAFGLVLFSVLFSAFGIFEGTRAPDLRRVRIPIRDLPPELEGFRIAVAADLHASRLNGAAFVQAVAKKILSANPDMIVFPGDLVDGRVTTRREDMKALKLLHAPFGVYACPGNHEYYSGYPEWMRQIRRFGIDMLENEGRIVSVRGVKVGVAGIGDPAAYRLFERGETVLAGKPPLPVKALRMVKSADFVIFLAHRPDSVFGASGVDLQISGHTHGGLFLLFDRFIVAPLNGGFVRGMYRIGKTILYVSSGAGLWSGYPVRVGIPSEIAVLELVREPSAGLKAEPLPVIPGT